LRKLERCLWDSDEEPVLVGIEEIIDEARNGRMFILVDDEDRENEGDLVIPAQMATPGCRQLHGHAWPRADLPNADQRRGASSLACR
jgi:hypothetical protein